MVMGESRKGHKGNVQDVKPVYPTDELIRCLSDVTTFGSVTKYK